MVVIMQQSSRATQWECLNRNKWALIKACFKCRPDILYRRAMITLFRRHLETCITTPEGLVLQSNNELIQYFAFFKEGVLAYKLMIKELRQQAAFNFIDVGANIGMCSQWIGSINKHGTFSCIEINLRNVQRGRELNTSIPIVWYNNGAHGWDDMIIEFNGAIARSITIDSITHFKSKIFGMKIDTDGNNVNVLEGARETLSKTKWLFLDREIGVEGWMKLNAPGFKLVDVRADWELIYENTYDR